MLEDKDFPNQMDPHEFANSERGRIIIAQALHYAIKVLEQVPAPHTEMNNIKDMEYLRAEVFDFPVEGLAVSYPASWHGVIPYPKIKDIDLV